MYETQESKITLITKEFQSICQDDEALHKHSESLLSRAELFREIDRKNIPLHGVGTNNIVERYFLFIKENVLKRQKAFNFGHVIVFLIVSKILITFKKLIKELSTEPDTVMKIKMLTYKANRHDYEYKVLN